MSDWDSLHNAFEFSDEDLAANQGGKITDWQRRRLRDQQSKMLPMLIVPVPFAVLVIAFGKGSALAALALIAITAFLTYTNYVRWRSFVDESSMADGVTSSRGWLTKRRIDTRYGARYRLDINGSEFKITAAQYDSVIEGRQYRIYFTPLSRTIISVETEAAEFEQRGSLAARLGTL